MSYESVEERIVGRWGKNELTTPHLKGKIFFEDSLHKLIDLCLTCDPQLFPEYVHRLYWSLPKAWRDEGLDQELKEATETVEYTTPVLCCGVPVDPSVLPGTIEIKEETDWHQLFNAIMDCVNRRGLLTPVERTEIITEKAPEEEQK